MSCPALSVCVVNESGQPTCECNKGYTFMASDTGDICAGWHYYCYATCSLHFTYSYFNVKFTYYVHPYIIFQTWMNVARTCVTRDVQTQSAVSGARVIPDIRCLLIGLVQVHIFIWMLQYESIEYVWSIFKSNTLWFQNVQLVCGAWIVRTNVNVERRAHSLVISSGHVCASQGIQGILVKQTLTNVNRIPIFVVISSNVWITLGHIIANVDRVLFWRITRV